MKWISKVFILALFSITFTGCVDRVTPGYAGVKVHNWGNDKGVDVEPLPVDRVIYNPISTDIYKFPTFVQHVTWDKYDREDESLVINTTEGSTIEFDAAVAIKFNEALVPNSTFRKPETCEPTMLQSSLMSPLYQISSQSLGLLQIIL